MECRTRNTAFGVVALFLITLGCSKSPPPAPPVLVKFQDGQPTLRSKLSDAELSILEDATKVEVFRVSPDPVRDSPQAAIGAYPILSTGKDQDQAFAASLSTLLLGDGVTESHKFCGFQPGVAYRIWKDDQAIEVLICFNCSVLSVRVVSESEGDHKVGRLQDFDAVFYKLLDLAKKAFPNDSDLRGIQHVL